MKELKLKVILASIFVAVIAVTIFLVVNTPLHILSDKTEILPRTDFHEKLAKTPKGTEQRINPFTTVENLGGGEFRAEISTSPQTTPDGKEMDITWHQQEDTEVYRAGNNLFSVLIDGTKTTVEQLYDLLGGTKKGQKAVWQPQVFLNEKEIKPVSNKPILLEVDPGNENYINNVLEWDYGICKRRLRLIEGAVFELYIFEENPNGDIEIKSNSQGDLDPADYYAVDNKGMPLEGFRVESDKKILPKESFNNVDFPVEVDDSFSGYSNNSDSYIVSYGYIDFGHTYPSIQSADGTGVYIYKNPYSSIIEIGQETYWYADYGKEYEIYRGYFYFDTSAIPVGSTIDSATLALYVADKTFTNANCTNFDVVVQSGQPTYPHDPLQNTDFNKNYYSGNGGSINTNNINTGQYNNISLNSTGRGWINLGGTTKLCLRSSRDINANPPAFGDYVGAPGHEDIDVYSSEQGSGYQPKLIITYTTPTTPQISVTPSSQNFGDVYIGSTKDLMFTVQNSGQGTLNGSVSGLSAPFSCVSGCSYNLSAGASQTTSIRFSPTSEGSFSDTAVFSGGDGANRNVSGNGIASPSTNCGLPHTGSDMHINSTEMGSDSCEVDGEVGIEDGNLYIDSGVTIQMNPNSTIIFNQGKFIRVDGIIAKSANNTVIRKGHISACECTSGACCSDGCNWDDASTVCSTWTEYDYQCSGTGCGDDAQRKSRSASKYCSGSSSSCTGSTSYGTWSEWSLLDNCTATEKCSSDNSTYANCSYASECDTVCDCTSGACCDGCNYRPSSYVCDSTYQTDYGCPWGTGCGDDVGVRYKTRKCSGSSSSCNGTISAWGSYSTYDNCASTETCTNNDSSCNYTPSCNCDCTSGACCDGCNYRPSSYVCDSTYQTDYGCPWGTGCGDDVGVRYKTRKCSGSSSSCNGTISAWGSYSTYDNCASTETCTNNDSSCNYTPSCDTPPNPSDDIQDCASYGVYDGTSIAVGTAHTGDLLAQNPEGSSFKNYWCKIGTNCTVDEGGTHEIMMWVSGDSVMCKKSPWVCASWHCHVESTFYTGCMYCIVK
jgi:hypothetical protein